MKNAGFSIVSTALVAIAALIIASNLGVIGITWPWERIPEVMAAETIVEQPVEAVVYDIEPIALDCRARIRASVPIEGRREHTMFGQVYRTDTVSMTALGDIDTCVAADRVEIAELADGRFQVLVPASAITFERPRVDAVATRDSVRIDKGMIGKFTDALPWVSDGSGLTPAAYAYAQDVVGSSECMRRAWDITAVTVRRAYQEQLAAQGGDRDAVTVVISGAPTFPDPPAGRIEAFDFTVAGGGVDCRVDGGAYDVDVAETGSNPAPARAGLRTRPPATEGHDVTRGGRRCPRPARPRRRARAR